MYYTTGNIEENEVICFCDDWTIRKVVDNASFLLFKGVFKNATRSYVEGEIVPFDGQISANDAINKEVQNIKRLAIAKKHALNDQKRSIDALILLKMKGINQLLTVS